MMVYFIEKTDNLPEHIDGVGNEYQVREGLTNGPGNDGFAAAGGPEQEYGPAADQGWPDPVQEILGNHQLREYLFQAAFLHLRALDGLSFHPFPVIFQGNRHRPDVTVEFQRIFRPPPALLT